MTTHNTQGLDGIIDNVFATLRLERRGYYSPKQNTVQP